jgi:hypothetical protein
MSDWFDIAIDLEVRNQAKLVEYWHPLETFNVFWSAHVLDHLDRMMTASKNACACSFI